MLYILNQSVTIRSPCLALCTSSAFADSWCEATFNVAETPESPSNQTVSLSLSLAPDFSDVIE